MTDARHWIEALQLGPHPEGGYFRQVYRSAELIAREHLPGRFNGDRAFSTSIYFLLAGDDFSALHRIRQDEVWHFYDGSSLTIHAIDPEGRYVARQLGRGVQHGESLQVVIPAGHLFGATVNDSQSYALVGCTVAPGFDFDDFELPSRDVLVQQYPQHQQLIERLTR
jgi:predicted cupin superfamily sugar epimerase